MFCRSTRSVNKIAARAYSQTAGSAKPPAGTPTPSAEPSINANVPGLSSNCVKPTTQPVGPGASTTAHYKVPEYFCYNRFSYAEADVEMTKYRLPQPSALK